MKKNDILTFTLEKLTQWFESHKIAGYRARQVFKWIYLKQIDDFDQMTDLTKDMRSLLNESFTIGRLVCEQKEKDPDQTEKYLFQLNDGHYIESVFIPDGDRNTLCISTQVGCAQGCRFCLTAQGGFTRNLTNAEILAQVRDVCRDFQHKSPITNIVIMGMGEPLANFSSLKDALSIITDGDVGLKFSPRRITLSTVGLINRFPDLSQLAPVNLAISLNAADDKTRNFLMPINHTYPIKILLDACRKIPMPPRRKITFEYILIKNVNDSDSDAHKLAKLLHPRWAKINLIPFNAFNGSSFEPSLPETIHNFQEILYQHRYTAMIRKSKGQKISAACGQLRANQYVGSSRI